MAQNTIWASATRVGFEIDEPGEYGDSSGQSNDQLALIIGTGDLPLVAEGTLPEMRAMLMRGIAVVDAYEKSEAR